MLVARHLASRNTALFFQACTSQSLFDILELTNTMQARQKACSGVHNTNGVPSPHAVSPLVRMGSFASTSSRRREDNGLHMVASVPVSCGKATTRRRTAFRTSWDNQSPNAARSTVAYACDPSLVLHRTTSFLN